MEPDVFLEHVLYADPISGQCRICSGAGLRSGMQCSNRWQILVLFAFFVADIATYFTMFICLYIYTYIHFSAFPIRVEDTAAAELLDIERVQKSKSCNQSQLLRV